MDGTAEIFGCEMPPRKEFAIKDAMLAVFSWNGCTLQVKGTPSLKYKGSGAEMTEIVRLHAQLERLRDTALGARTANPDSAASGPRVVVAGGTDSGKSTLCRTLALYAARRGRQPLLLDVDVGQRSVSVPGTITAVHVDRSCLVPTEPLAHAVPLTYFYGHSTPADDPELYRHCVSNLAEAVDKRMQSSAESESAGGPRANAHARTHTRTRTQSAPPAASSTRAAGWTAPATTCCCTRSRRSRRTTSSSSRKNAWSPTSSATVPASPCTS